MQEKNLSALTPIKSTEGRSTDVVTIATAMKATVTARPMRTERFA